MKKQNLSFLKLLCFKNKFNLLFLDVFCIFSAVIFSCIWLNYAVVAPSEDIINVCETALYEYLENPYEYSPPSNVSIILDENAIIAAFPRAFTFLIATQNENQTYLFDTQIKFGAFLFFYFVGFSFRVVFLYFSSEVLLCVLMHFMKFFLKLLNKSKNYFSKKFLHMQNNIERQLKQKGVKEYEIPRLQEIYQLGYNMGHADGIAEGSKLGKSDLPYQN